LEQLTDHALPGLFQHLAKGRLLMPNGYRKRVTILLLGMALGLMMSIDLESPVAESPAVAGDDSRISPHQSACTAPDHRNNHSCRSRDHPINRPALSEEDDWAFLPLISQDYRRSRLTYPASNDTHPAFSADGDRIVFLSDRDGRSDVFRGWITGGSVVNLTRTSSADEDTPVISPDGLKVAFASNRSGDWDILLMDLDGTDVRVAVGNPDTDELHPSFAPDGRGLAFSSNCDGGNWDIYTATICSQGPWARLTSDPAIDRFPTVSADGRLVTFRSERDGNSEIYLMKADGSDLRRITDNTVPDGYPTITSDGSGIVFASSRAGRRSVFLVNLAGEGLVELEQDQQWHARNPRTSVDGRRLLYAGGPIGRPLDIYGREFTSPLLAVGERGASNLREGCDWEEGVLAFGWIHAWQATRDEQYRRWTQEWVGACVPLKGEVSHVNDGLLGYAALKAYEISGQPQYLAFANWVADYLLDIAPRTADGTLTHDSHRVWIDSLLGSVPFLVEMSQVTGSDIYIEEAITQTVKHAEHLQDPDSGLYYHAWDETESDPAGHVYWGRGNGWALLADVALLSVITDSHPSHANILNGMQRHAEALRMLQDSSGLWRTALTQSDSYLETSASSLIGYGFKCGVERGWLDREIFSASAEAAKLGVWRHVLADGTVTDVSGPTWPMMTEEDYDARPHDKLQLYGQGLALLLESPDVRAMRLAVTGE
jgi:unsaturated rhamnogalacturonyl hydrolase